MASIEPTDRQGVWRARAHLGRDAAGRQVRPRTTITAPTKGKAQRKADQWEDELRAAGRTDFRKVTVAEAVDAWLEGCEAKGLAARTLHSYRQLGRDIRAELGARHVDQLTVADVQGFYRRLTTRGTRISHHHAALRGVLNEAARHGWVNKNVATLTRRPAERAKRGAPPTVDEMVLLVKTAARRDPVLGRLLLVAMQTGMRRGELAAMRCSRVNADDRTYLVDAAAAGLPGRGVFLKEPKTHQVRTVPLSGVALAAVIDQGRWLEERAALAGTVLVADPFVWSPGLDGGRPPDPDWLTRSFAAVCREAGIRVRFHDQRHATATLLLDMGVALPTVSEILGHATPATTASIYAHGVSVSGRRAADELGHAFAGELEA